MAGAAPEVQRGAEQAEQMQAVRAEQMQAVQAKASHDEEAAPLDAVGVEAAVCAPEPASQPGPQGVTPQELSGVAEKAMEVNGDGEVQHEAPAHLNGDGSMRRRPTCSRRPWRSTAPSV